MFKYSELSDFLNKLKSIAPVLSFITIKDNTVGTILRHDIDVIIEKAYDFAQIEFDLGITSSILFLTTCPLYNVNSSENRKLIKKLADQNFDIGLHFDPTIYQNLSDDVLAQKVDQESAIIEDITGIKVSTISLHCPSIHGLYPFFEGYINAYDKPYFNESMYMSDSRMSFRDKKPSEFILNARNNLIQVLLHPFHYSKEGFNYHGLFKKLINRHLEIVDDSFRPYNSQYVSDLGDKKLKEIIQ